MAKYKVHTDLMKFAGPGMDDVEIAKDPLFLNIGEYQLRGTGDEIDEKALSERLSLEMKKAAMKRKDRGQSDARFASIVFDMLPLSRRDAADKDLWTYLNTTACRHYVAWRWAVKGSVGRRRYDGGLDRSALARLWWSAKMLEAFPAEQREEALTSLFKWQDRQVGIYERPRLWRRDKVPASLVNQLTHRGEEWDENGFREMCRSTRIAFGVKLTQAMSAEQVADIIDDRAANTIRNDP